MSSVGITRLRLVFMRAEDVWALGDWYRDVLGLEPLPQPAGDTGPWPPQFALGDTTLELGGGGARQPIPTRREDVPVCPIFEVVDAEATLAALTERGVTIVAPIRVVGGGRSKLFYACD
ncbi:MAG: hypothetical protein NZ518_06000, partial [Dehalococcoidia bacterium]|nr:hypothetical protein [Dehalococcoidia bacterium]